jgi:hypothetical protein
MIDSKTLIEALRSRYSDDKSHDLVVSLRRILWDRLRRQTSTPDDLQPFRPECRFDIGDWVGIHGWVAQVVAVREGGNPRQGRFVVIDLEGEDGSRRSVAAHTTAVPHADLQFAIPDSMIHATLSTHRERLSEALPGFRMSSSVNGDDFERDTTVGGQSQGFSASRVQLATVPRVRAMRFLSDDEIDEIWARHPDWEGRARTTLSTLCSLWTEMREPGEKQSQEALQTYFLQPLLEALGWYPEPLNGATTHDPKSDHSRSRWALYSDEDARQSARYTSETFRHASPESLILNVGLRWNKQSREVAEFDDLAMDVVADLMLSGARWGGATDGRRWRLYSRRWDNPDVGSTAAEFYEVDLAPIVKAATTADGIHRATWTNFRRWWILWQKESYVPTEQGRTLIEVLQEQTAVAARDLVERLRAQMLECILPEIAGGFLEYRHQELSLHREGEDTLKQVARASLLLAYKLLFVIVAEARGVLPMDHPAYRASSLTTLIHWANHAVQRDTPASSSFKQTPKYEAVLSLFRRFDHGAPALAMIRIEGELFSATDSGHTFLERHRLSDRTMVRILHALSLDGEAEANLASVDLRHLCMIGEKLLENALWIVDSALGEATWIDTRKGSRPTASKPVADYVVISTVEDALRPILTARAAAYEHAMERLVRVRRRENVESLDRVSPAVRSQITQLEDRAVQALMGVKILDPAMGAGHFLIVAADVLADWAIAQHRAYYSAHCEIPESWDPIFRALFDARNRVRHQMSSLGQRLPPGWPDELALIASWIVGACIYGVDIDPVAVNLAKANLSLWAFARGGAQLDFGHHLCRGNSLLGRRLRDTDLTSRRDLDLIGGVSALGTQTRRVDDHRTVLSLEREALDLWISQFVGNNDAESFLEGDVDILALLDRPAHSRPASFRRALKRAKELSDRKGFIHWDLAFPDVFYDPRRRGDHKRAGFDVVIGGPPTVKPEDGRLPDIARRSRLDDEDATIARIGSPPYEALARQLVRSPGGRIALVMTPTHIMGARR